MPVRFGPYYQEYFGHPVKDLTSIHDELRAQGKDLIFLAGDSSLDNKVWFSNRAAAVNGYEQDVCYWMNYEAANSASRDGTPPVACINTAIEATSLNNRSCGMLLKQDAFIRDHITEEDTLVVSVGGNDVALQPLLCTCANVAALAWCSGPVCCIQQYGVACPPNSWLLGDLGCIGCGIPNCITGGLCGFPLGMGYMVDLFKNRVQNYVRALCSKRTPKKVVVCMIYYLDERRAGSWADGALSCLCYDAAPWRLQAAIEAAFRLGTQSITVPGTEVVPFPLFRVLDGKNTSDYCQRVEPSPQGGHKMASALMARIIGTGGLPADHGSGDPSSEDELIAPHLQ